MGLFDFLTKFQDKSDPPCATEIRSCDELWEAVNLVVKLSHPNIQYVSNYRKKLRPAVEHTLKYADDLIAHMPPPVLIDADSWNTNPFIRTAFLDSSQFKLFFSEHKALKNFFDKTNASRCCGLLVMNRKEKKILGAEMDGEIIQRDVLQTSIDFSDHQMVAVTISEEETRKELSMHALTLLAAHSLEDILSLIKWKEEMETEKQILEIKLDIRHAHVRSRRYLLPDISDETGEASEVLDQLGQKIAEIQTEIDEPEDYLNRVTNLLYHPEQFLKSESVRIYVNDMNIIKNKHQGKSNEICFIELSTNTGLRKATVLVDYKRF